MVFHWRLSDSKSPRVSRRFLNHAIEWMISAHPLIPKFSNPCTKPLWTVPSALIIIDIIVIFIFDNIFSSLARSKHLFLFSFSFILTLLSTRKPLYSVNFRSSLSSGLDLIICLYLKIPEKLCVSCSWTDSGLCIYQLVVESHFNFLPNFRWITRCLQ